MEEKEIEVHQQDGKTWTPEFKNMVDTYIKEQITRVTTNGKLDKNKAVKYILEHIEDESLPF